MKNKNKMHESLIGKIIYGFLMFMPLLSILTSCLYVVFNPNAKDSYSGTSTQYIPVNYETNEVNTSSDLIIGNLYAINYTITVSDNTNYYVGEMSSFDFIFLKDIDYIKDYDNYYLWIRPTINGQNNTAIFIISKSNQNMSDYFFYIGSPVAYDNYKVYYPFIYKGGQIDTTYITEADLTLTPPLNYEEIEATNLDNAFDYAIQNTENSALYNWTTQTGTYQIIELTTTTLEIDNSFVNLLLTYWLLITIIYIIYDIALIMVLLVHRKVHELIDR